MEPKEIYKTLKHITDGTWEYNSQLVIIAKWIAANFEKKENND